MQGRLKQARSRRAAGGGGRGGCARRGRPPCLSLFRCVHGHRGHTGNYAKTPLAAIQVTAIIKIPLKTPQMALESTRTGGSIPGWPFSFKSSPWTPGGPGMGILPVCARFCPGGRYLRGRHDPLAKKVSLLNYAGLFCPFYQRGVQCLTIRRYTGTGLRLVLKENLRGKVNPHLDFNPV